MFRYFKQVFALSIFIIFELTCVNGKNIDIKRQNRALWGPYSTTVTQTQIVQSFVPSSCVQVAATLPPCRNVRLLQFPSFIANHLGNDQTAETTETVTGPSNISENTAAHEDLKSTKVPSWGEYLGIYPTTTTVTEIHLQTTVVEDPRITVTFAVKGCRPLRLPLDLKRCPEEESSPIQVPTIVPTSTIASINPEPTKQNANMEPNIVVSNETLGEILESTKQNMQQNVNENVPTQPLP